jgi:hypothetical protein
MKLARAQVGIFILVALLQRTPVVKYVLQYERALSAPIAKMVKMTTWVATSMGLFHATAGATTYSIVPASSADATVGEAFNLAFTITGTPEEVRSWEVTGEIPPGLSVPGISGDTLNSGVGTITGTPTAVGSYSISIKPWDSLNLSGDTTTASTIVINVAAPPLPDPPTILRKPSSTRVPTGGRAQFFFESSGVVDSIQWLKDDVALAGETGQTLIIPTATAADEGAYTVQVTNAGGSATSDAGSLTIDDTATANLANLATRGLVGTGGDIMIGGLTVLGGSTKTVLVRGLGPELTEQSVPGALADPALNVFQTLFDEGRSQLLTTNDNWGEGANAAELAAALDALGKNLVAGSKDAALLLTLNEGVYTFQLYGVGGTEGVGLIELFVVE